MQQDYHREERRARVLAMQPARPARTRQTVIAVVTLIVISQVLAFLFIEAAL